MSWNKLKCSHSELQLLGTLNGGQSFRWEHNKNSEWTGIFSKTVWKLRQTEDDYFQYQVLGTLLNNCDYEKLLVQYFRLNLNLNDYYKEWSQKDELFKNACKQFYGIRMLAQEPVENLFSFICSQNNHITRKPIESKVDKYVDNYKSNILLKYHRISGMVEKLCKHYGEEICQYEDSRYYAFPEVEKLAQPKVEAELRQLGFGYRAKFIQKSAAQIVEWGGMEWIKTLQDMKYKDAKPELMKLCGIGPKVADCICLMSLNHLEALPVDTHVYQIAAQNYLPHLRGKKNVTDKMYSEIGDHFRNLYGPLAGWAHTVLFCADLKKFQHNDIESEAAVKPKKRKTK